MTDHELIERAVATLNPMRLADGNTSGSVAAALLTRNRSVFTGVCIDTRSSLGFCAEHNAIGSMITAGETRILTLVAVKHDETGAIRILPPCGRCRELLYQVDTGNLETEVILGSETRVKLRDLLPFFRAATQPTVTREDSAAGPSPGGKR